MMLPYDCDGMVLLYSETDICVCNPTTGETLHLPGFSPGRPLYKDPVQYLGFSLDRLTNLYKVVHFYYHSFEFSDHHWEVGCEVFTLGAAATAKRFNLGGKLMTLLFVGFVPDKIRYRQMAHYIGLPTISLFFPSISETKDLDNSFLHLLQWYILHITFLP